MTGPLSSEHIEELMTGYVLGELSAEETEEFERLLAENPQLATEVNLWQEALELLPYSLPAVEPPPHLHSAILNAVRAESESNLESNREPARIRSRLPWGKLVASIAALLAVALGLDNYRLRQELRTARLQREIVTVLQQANTRVLSLTGTGETSTASGSIAINLNQQKAAIAFQNLPVPPADRVYRLWAIVDRQPTACAEFSPSQQGKVLDEFSIRTSVCSNPKSTFAVSLEPSSLPPKPVGPIVMVEKS